MIPKGFSDYIFCFSIITWHFLSYFNHFTLHNFAFIALIIALALHQFNLLC